MRNFIQRILAGPQFEDEDQTRAARLLNVIFVITLALNVTNIAGLLWIQLDTIGINLNLVFTVVQIGMLWLLWRGYVRSMSFAFCSFIYLLANILAYNTQGLLSPIYVANICTIIAGGLLLGGWAAVFFTVMSVVAGLVFVLTAYGGIHPTQLGMSTAGLAFVDYSVIFVFVGLVSWISDGAVKNALSRARSNERALLEQNQALQHEIHERQQVEVMLRETERALRESEQRFRVALAGAPIRVANLNRDLRYTWVYNSPWFETEEIIGKTDADLLPLESAERVTKLKQQVLDSGIGHREVVEVEVKGEMRYLDITIEPLHDLTGQITGVTTASYNITDQKRAQQEAFQNELLRVEVEKNKRLAQLKDSFVTMVLHEFRTPLTIINSSKELLDIYHDRLTDERRRGHLTKIGVEVQHMVDLLDDILTLSKASAGMLDFHPTSINLKHFCRSIFEEFSALQQQPFTLLFSCADTCDREVMTDSTLLRSTLFNLLSNAVKYSPPGSKIEFEAGCSAHEAQFRVTDQGMGIPLEDQEKLFEPFHRGRNAKDIGGTGLGLAIVKNSLEAHGGTVSVESHEGIGTTFFVRLPLHKLSKTA